MQAEITETIQLVRDAKSGDRDALDRLFARFAPFVRRIIQLRLGKAPSRREDIDDLVQDALVRAYEGLDNFAARAEDNFRAWLATCARCAIFDDHKRKRALKRGAGKGIRTFTEYGSDYLSSSIFAGKEPTPSAVARRAELEKAIFEGLEAMEERHRNLILYRQLCDMSYREIADRLGLRDESHARVLCHRALKHLRERLAG